MFGAEKTAAVKKSYCDVGIRNVPYGVRSHTHLIYIKLTLPSSKLSVAGCIVSNEVVATTNKSVDVPVTGKKQRKQIFRTKMLLWEVGKDFPKTHSPSISVPVINFHLDCPVRKKAPCQGMALKRQRAKCNIQLNKSNVVITIIFGGKVRSTGVEASWEGAASQEELVHFPVSACTTDFNQFMWSAAPMLPVDCRCK